MHHRRRRRRVDHRRIVYRGHADRARDDVRQVVHRPAVIDPEGHAPRQGVGVLARVRIGDRPERRLIVRQGGGARQGQHARRAVERAGDPVLRRKTQHVLAAHEVRRDADGRAGKIDVVHVRHGNQCVDRRRRLIFGVGQRTAVRQHRRLIDHLRKYRRTGIADRPVHRSVRIAAAAVHERQGDHVAADLRARRAIEREVEPRRSRIRTELPETVHDRPSRQRQRDSHRRTRSQPGHVDVERPHRERQSRRRTGRSCHAGGTDRPVAGYERHCAGRRLHEIDRGHVGQDDGHDLRVAYGRRPVVRRLHRERERRRRLEVQRRTGRHRELPRRAVDRKRPARVAPRNRPGERAARIRVERRERRAHERPVRRVLRQTERPRRLRRRRFIHVRQIDRDYRRVARGGRPVVGDCRRQDKARCHLKVQQGAIRHRDLARRRIHRERRARQRIGQRLAGIWVRREDRSHHRTIRAVLAN